MSYQDEACHVGLLQVMMHKITIDLDMSDTFLKHVIVGYLNGTLIVIVD